MTILDQLAGCARERTGQAKLRISLEELKQQALSMPKGNFTFEKASIGVQGVQTRLKRNVRFESK